MTFDGEAAALAWCDTERHNLVATALCAGKLGLHEIGWKLPTALFPFFDRRRHFGDWISTHQTAAVAAGLAGDLEAEGKVRCNLGSAYRPMRRFDEARHEYERALDLFRRCDWRQGVAKVLGNLASTHHATGNNEQAIMIGTQAAGQYDRAMATLTEALAAFQAIGDQRGVARTQGNIGQTAGRMGKHEQAIPVLLAAIRTFEQIADLHEQATNLADLAGSYAAIGQHEQARRAISQAADIFSALDEDWLVTGLRQRFPDLVP